MNPDVETLAGRQQTVWAGDRQHVKALLQAGIEGRESNSRHPVYFYSYHISLQLNIFVSSLFNVFPVFLLRQAILLA